MGIKSKFTYLNETKDLLKEEISRINVVSDSDTFRSYKDKLHSGYLDILNNGTDTLWSNLEKVSQTGTEAVLEGVETAPIKMVLNGNTNQETTTGKNIFNYTRTTKTITTNGVTSTINDDGSITLDGTATALTWFVLNSAFNWESGDYTMYLTDKKIDSFILFSDVGGTDTIKQINVATTITKNISLRIEPNTSFNNLTFFPMILKGKYTLENIGNYEPYTGGQPSPNPDYPQEVKVVTGENVVSVSGKNCLVPFVFNRTNNGIEFNYNADGSITINGTSTGTAYAIATSSVPLFTKLKAGTYTLSTTGNIAIRLDDSNGVNIVNTTTSTTFTLTEDKEVYIQIRIGSGTTIINQTIYPMIEQNSQATPYVPYSKTDYPINLVSKNLFSTENLVNATITDTGEYLTGDNRCTGDYAFLDKSQENLALSFNLNILFMGIAFYDENKQYLSRATINNTNLLTTPIPTNAEYCRPFFQFTTSPTAKIDAKIAQQLGTQLEYGAERTNYVSYFTPIELCKINTYKDYFHKDNGKWYVHKEIGKKIFDGSESWVRSGTRQSTEYFRFRTSTLQNLVLAPSSSSVLMNAYCDLFVIQTADDTYRRIEGISAISNGQMDIYYEPLKEYTNIEFKTWLSNNNVTLYYILATPTDTEITNTTLIEQLEAIYKAKSVKDKTYITQTNDDLPFILDVEAIKEYSAE